MSIERPIAVYHEHPDWFRPLFAEFERRGTPYIRLDARRHRYDPDVTAEEFSLFFNRMSASAYLRGNGNGIFFTANYLAHLENSGTRVINGRDAFLIETSKALQLSLLKRLGLPFPRSRVINAAIEASAAARDMQFPVVVKPNIGGRGAGIVRFDTLDSLARMAEEGRIDLGIDQTAVVQEYIPARGGHITRVETLGGKFLYAIKVYPTGESFNLCPAEICQVEEAARVQATFCIADAPKSGLKVEPCTPAPEIIEAVERIVSAARIDVGGIEYIIDDGDRGLMFYDINALSNFVADAPKIVGFEPHSRLVDYLEQEARK